MSRTRPNLALKLRPILISDSLLVICYSMANIFQDKMVKYLTLGLCLVAVGLLAQNLLAKPKPSLPLPQSQSALQALPQIPQVALNPKNLENLKVENLKPFELVGFPARIGRVDPFEPYPLVEEIATSTATTTVATSTSTATSTAAAAGPATTTATTTTIATSTHR